MIVVSSDDTSWLAKPKISSVLFTAMRIASEAGGRRYFEFHKRKEEWNLSTNKECPSARKACRNIFPGGRHSERKYGKEY